MEKCFQIKNSVIHLVKGDMTELNVETIVNAANSSLLGGGGVDGAIHRKGGRQILDECQKIRVKDWPEGLPTGKAVITSGGRLLAKHVIHTVGPVWRGGNYNEENLLKEAYENSLVLAASEGLKSVAFPSISTGSYGYPVDKASVVALNTVKEFLEKKNIAMDVVFVLHSTKDFEVYLNAANRCLV